MAGLRFSRRTVIAAVEVLVGAIKTHDDLTRYFLKLDQDLAARGKDEADALDQAADALEEAIAARMKHGVDIPLASHLIGPLVPVPMQTALKAALYLTLRGARGRQSALAERIGKDEQEVRRLLDPHHRSRPKSIERALRALGKRATVVLEDAA